MVTTPSQQAIKILRNLFATHGLPEMVVLDNGSAFTSAEFQTFVKRNGIRHVRSAPYHPSSNGQAERVVQTFKEAILKTTSWMQGWPDFYFSIGLHHTQQLDFPLRRCCWVGGHDLTWTFCIQTSHPRCLKDRSCRRKPMINMPSIASSRMGTWCMHVIFMVLLHRSQEWSPLCLVLCPW